MTTATQSRVSIRLATVKDLPELLTFIDVSSRMDLGEYEVRIDIDILRKSLSKLLEIRGIIIAEIEGVAIGAIAGYTQDCLFTKDIILSVMFFYVRKSFRRFTKEFLKEVELGLLPTNITRISFGFPEFANHDKMARYMRMNGYKILETHFYKAV